MAAKKELPAVNKKRTGGLDGGEDVDASAEDQDALMFGPRRDQLKSKGSAAAAAGGEGGKKASGGGSEPVGVYKPPKINPVTMEE